MPCKSFKICVVLHISDVTCPGVWLCPNGMVYLDIRLFGFNSCTSCVEPRFPLTFDETFSFHENLSNTTNLKDLQRCLEEKSMSITLVQVYKKKQVTLATYNSSVDEFLYPESSRLNKINGETALLMKNEPLFPGTISPKITLVTKTSITEQINPISNDDHCSSHNLKTQNRPNSMRRVHHTKLMNSSGSSNTDSDIDCQLYCQRSTKNIVDHDCNLKGTCKQCEVMDISKMHNHSIHKNESSNNDVCNTEKIFKAFGKNIKATFNVGVHHYKCCKSNMNNSSSTNESIKTSDEDIIKEQKNIRTDCKLDEDNGVEPRKINPKIKAKLHLDVYHCKCDMPSSVSNPSWKNICREVNRKDFIEDSITYHMSLRNYYRRLYEGATNQLNRNLKLL